LGIWTKKSFLWILSETEAVAGVETEKDVGEKLAVDDVAADANKENTVVEEKEPEDKVNREWNINARLLFTILVSVFLFSLVVY